MTQAYRQVGAQSQRRRVAIIGLGMAVAPHAKSLLDLANRVEVAAAISPTSARRDAFARQYAFPTSADINAVAADPTISAVGILTPPSTHFELVRRMAAAGKHILLEKPLDITTQRAEALVQYCRSAGVKLGVVLQHRFRPSGARLRAIIDEGGLGEIINCSTSIRLWRPQSYYDEPGRGTKARDGGGVLLTQGIHTLDLMLWLAGPVSDVMGYALTSPVHRMETEDMVAAAARFANGAIGVIEATTAAYPGAPERIDIIGRLGSASIAGSALSVAWHDGRHEAIAADSTTGGTGADPMAFPHDYHRDIWTDFLDCLDTGREPIVNGAQALRVHRLIDALLDAGRTGRSAKVAVEV